MILTIHYFTSESQGQTEVAGSGIPLHDFDKELQRRRMLLFLYLVRSPLFDQTTLPAIRYDFVIHIETTHNEISNF